MTKELNFNQFEILTFDCYGTLIDWENGILDALRPFFKKHSLYKSDNEILEIYAKLEANIEKKEYIKYAEVLKKIMSELAKKFELTLSSEENNILVNSIKNWKAFPDAVESLQSLKKKYKLAIISNVDDELFTYSNEHLKVEFDHIITAEQVGSYKPSVENFKFAINKMGITPDKILHVAQSIYHDIVPAKELGLSTVWINRRKDKQGFGATPEAQSEPDLKAPDLKTLVNLIGLK